MALDQREIGGSGIAITPLVFGGNVFGWTADRARSFALLDAFVNAGGTCIDTADVYSRWAPGNQGGESETILGDWMQARGNRGHLVIATKGGMDMGDGRKGLSKAYLLRAVEASLRRLRTDRIDLYQSHRDDPETPIEETLEAYAGLIRDGKIRAVGASNFSAERLDASLRASDRLGLPRYQCLQPLYNLYDRSEFEGPLEALCRKEGLGVISYFSLASGFLTGKYRSANDSGKSVRGGGMAKYLNERGQRILAALDAVAAELAATPAQVALAWLMARPGVTAPIASATSVEQITELWRATDLRLHSEAIARLDAAGAAAPAG